MIYITASAKNYTTYDEVKMNEWEMNMGYYHNENLGYYVDDMYNLNIYSIEDDPDYLEVEEMRNDF